MPTSAHSGSATEAGEQGRPAAVCQGSQRLLNAPRVLLGFLRGARMEPPRVNQLGGFGDAQTGGRQESAVSRATHPAIIF